MNGSVAGRGGAIGSESVELAGLVPGLSTVDIRGDHIDGNTAAGAGGGIYSEGDLAISHAVISNNLAIGQADSTIDFYPGYLFHGAAVGGGISSFSGLEVHATRVQGNEARGADGASGPNAVLVSPGAIPTYPGLAVGGGIHNFGDAWISKSQVLDNAAIGGSGNVGSFAGVGNGGGVYNDAQMHIQHTRIANNESIGGDQNVGDINAGGGYGGGVTSGSVTALVGLRSASLTGSHLRVVGNKAAGGDDNSGLAPLPGAHLPAGGIGGGILVYQGAADISKSLISRNQAKGGEGGIGGGGGIFFLGFVGGVDASLSQSLVTHNRAIGGDGANGVGGGIASGTLGSLLAANVSSSLTRVLVIGNQARGGDEDDAMNVGDALGGGIFNDASSDLTLTRSKVLANRAVAEDGGNGIGGGLYNLGNVDLIRAHIFANFASTSDDDCFGC